MVVETPCSADAVGRLTQLERSLKGRGGRERTLCGTAEAGHRQSSLAGAGGAQVLAGGGGLERLQQGAAPRLLLLPWRLQHLLGLEHRRGTQRSRGAYWEKGGDPDTELRQQTMALRSKLSQSVTLHLKCYSKDTQNILIDRCLKAGIKSG